MIGPNEQPEGFNEQPEPPVGRAGRFWSARRVPAALTAAVVLGAAGMLLYDIAAVRADRSAMSWRRRLARELATRPLDNALVTGAAAAAAVIGLWLIVLALTPGERSVLPMRRSVAGVRAGLDRHAAELMLRDRAMEVSGVHTVRVTVGRRRITARAASHFRDLTEVRTDLGAALGQGMVQLGLAHPPHLTVHVYRAEKG
ncbi:DUF6286 domain-containing protein [Streptomyces sp. H10-C2]|uniref:DUF6286 domain-containing protein n=1 Tax=unclassified Streptomyces TaxID=2593676 RepID=UPI0024BB1B6A|nr:MULTISPECIES: DUF6286 domain-containing protein [unclassified Streptomyces]MDJ0344832.1 DUF6286 domain-containing protein [Streptomyces sp. PH10-H1]MDJ0371892.1 DUF6286 domain-containing protein [Streptomyces sp. H10-C2]